MWVFFLLRFIPWSAGNSTVSSIPELLRTDHPREMIQAALAHVVRNRVEVAYARSDLFERRRVLMNDGARYLAQGIACPHQGKNRQALIQPAQQEVSIGTHGTDVESRHNDASAGAGAAPPPLAPPLPDHSIGWKPKL